eukprot:445569-Rhodomonas_salina.4
MEESQMTPNRGVFDEEWSCLNTTVEACTRRNYATSDDDLPSGKRYAQPSETLKICRYPCTGSSLTPECRLCDHALPLLPLPSCTNRTQRGVGRPACVAWAASVLESQNERPVAAGWVVQGASK